MLQYVTPETLTNKSTESRNTGFFLLPRFLMVYADEAWREVTEDFQYPLSLKMQYQRGDRVECTFAQTSLKPFPLRRQRQVPIKGIDTCLAWSTMLF